MNAPAAPAAPEAPAPARGAPGVLTEVADGVHAFVQPHGGWCLNNAGLVLGETALLIDTAATESRTRRLREEVLRLVPDGPDLLVNTHFHGDHVFGNSHFTPRARVLAHASARSDMAESGLGLCGLWPDVPWGDLRLVLPDLTFRDALTVHTGDLSVELLHFGPAHTAGDVVAWVPERGVLFTGDVAWSQVTPFVLMGSFEGSFRALDRMRALRPRVVVAGHGPVAGPEVLDETERYLRHVLAIADDGLRAGLTPLEAARAAGPGPYAELPDAERLAANLHRAYAERSGTPPGGRIDVQAAFADLVALGGRLPECHA
ncbi:MBL fold metallo-hydrolase [Streptomyces sp. JJ66]|uniref:MBL fold metallo-hydrolase n=1 Tax=Streptomyces sp. JJ66 TaxID=2803843 RepID=UPI001C55F63E|nr:MBL fold metallo-hydrolase [Streptomyces sp. JJ66]MBW1602477.1 MBL fold metallo-hydrolase [Streptomyces sp. JJ66]